MPRKPRRPIRYIFRHRFRGTQEWICPWCGHVNIETDTHGRVFAFACRGVVVTENGNQYQCGIRLVFASVAYTVPSGRLSPPHDKVIPHGLAEAFPEGELRDGMWRSGRACNVLVVTQEEIPLPYVPPSSSGSGDGGRRKRRK